MNYSNELNEWYYQGTNSDLDVVVSNIKRDGTGPHGKGMGPGQGQGPCEPTTQSNELEAPSQTDMSSVPPESPQNDIQKEIEKQGKEQEQPTTADEVVYKDKEKLHRAFGMTELLKDKVKELYSMTGAYQNEPQKREQLAQDLKQLTRELSDLMGEI